ncbi:MAG: 1-acyl-sn-glycerol-3-phosphate acyltransferase [Bacteroidaceae bacterium]|nr:1-acyl-sn-glycerol-3-phosphate acyltransferase [Bacteroidaceae bacterium]
MSKIQDSTFAYRLGRFFVDKVTKHSYRKYQVEGKENIPDDGYVIWVANHSNALSDALALLVTNKSPKVFLCRADIFSKPILVKLFTYLKIMPIYRIRDGMDSVKKNTEVIEKCVDVLKSGTPITLFPEGTHQPKHTLLPLSKGVFHIAMQLEQAKKDNKPVYIQPIGINYSDFFRYRATCLVKFGKPFNVSQYLAEHTELDVPKQMLEMREILTGCIEKQIAYVPDNLDYDSVWEYTKLKSNNRRYFKHAITQIENDANKRFRGLERILLVNRYAIKEMLQMQQDEPERTAIMLEKIDKFRLWRIQNGISVYSVARKHPVLLMLKNILLLLISLPYYLFSIIVTFPVWVTTLVLLRHTHDNAFYNSIRVGVRISIGAIQLILWTVLFFVFIPHWSLALLLTLLLCPANMLITDYHELARRTMSDFKWSLSKNRFKHLSFLFE